MLLVHQFSGRRDIDGDAAKYSTEQLEKAYGRCCKQLNCHAGKLMLSVTNAECGATDSQAELLARVGMEVCGAGIDGSMIVQSSGCLSYWLATLHN